MSNKLTLDFLSNYVQLDHDEKKEIIKMLKCPDLCSALFKISNEVFRPARKHGYPDSKIEELMEKLGDDSAELVGLLEDKFNEILNEYGVMDLLWD